MGESVGAEALDAAAFVVDTDQQIGPHLLDLLAEFGELFAVFPVAGKQNHAPHQGVGQAALVGLGQAGAGHIDDERGVLGHVAGVSSCSTTTKLAA